MCTKTCIDKISKHGTSMIIIMDDFYAYIGKEKSIRLVARWFSLHKNTIGNI